MHEGPPPSKGRPFLISKGKLMQIVSCTIAIGGEVGMTVPKDFVSVPELLVLQAIHGNDAVRSVVVTGDESRDSVEERQRLSEIYKSPITIIRDVLGAQGPLPKTLKEAGFPDEFVVSYGDKKPGRTARPKPVDEQVETADEAAGIEE
jgi:hypothetical protein